MHKYAAVVIGASTGGLQALMTLLPEVPEDFFAPVIIVMHMDQNAGGFIPTYLNGLSAIHVKEAQDGEPLMSGTAYMAPPGYHLLVEKGNLALSVDNPVRYSRPSIDVLFESAADAYADELIGVVLTGANSDGSQGLEKIKRYSGLVIVQDPETAVAAAMPRAAIEAVAVDHILALDKIGSFFRKLHNETHSGIKIW